MPKSFREQFSGYYSARAEAVALLVKELRECVEAGAPPHRYDYISLMSEAADALELLEEVASK